MVTGGDRQGGLDPQESLTEERTVVYLQSHVSVGGRYLERRTPVRQWLMSTFIFVSPPH